MVNTIIEYLDQHQIKYERDVDLKKRTWIHRGGVASLFVIPSDSKQLADVVKFLYQGHHEFLLVGHTSNLYILNTANIPVVVSTLRCNKFELKGDRIYCEAGAGVI